MLAREPEVTPGSFLIHVKEADEQASFFTRGRQASIPLPQYEVSRLPGPND
jgi:hypothetical protein